jgi:prefoldin subunit 5
MTIDKLHARLKEIDQQMQQCVSTYNMLEGAKRECFSMIAEIQKNEEEKAKEEKADIDG